LPPASTSNNLNMTIVEITGGMLRAARSRAFGCTLAKLLEAKREAYLARLERKDLREAVQQFADACARQF
jgi:hypothetical protein